MNSKLSYNDENAKSEKITVLGSAHMDFITQTEKIPRVGETVCGGKFRMSPGGKGVNQAIATARMSCETEIISKIGKDRFGEILKEKIKEEKIGYKCLFEDENVSTSTATIIVDREGNNQIVVASEADESLTIEEIEKCKETIRNSKAILAQLELPKKTVKKTFKIASESGVMTFLNFAPAKDVSGELLKTTDFLILNEIELEDLVGKKNREFNSIAETANSILQRGPGALVVTRGEEGCTLVTEDYIENIDSLDVDVIDTTGAGDAFCAGFVRGVVSGKTLEESIQIGNAAGALTTRHIGALKALPSWSEVMNLL